MKYITRLLNTPMHDFTFLDAMGAIALTLIIVGCAMALLTAIEILIKQWRGER